MASKKRTVDKSETAGVECKMKRRKMVCCNCRRRRTNRLIASIPEEIVFNILLWLPADVIYNVMRYVCRAWYNIISSPDFISSHLQKSTVGLLLQRYSVPKLGYFVKMQKCKLEVKELKFRFAGAAVASCNGLVWIVDNKRRCNSYVANPVLNQQLALPQYHPGSLGAIDCSFAYAAASKVYKVVHYRDSKHKFILTVGIDKAWRPISMSQLTSFPGQLFVSPPLSLEGFLYWADYEVQFILSFDVETETFQRIPLPQGCENRLSSTHLAMGRSLSFMWSRDKYLWEVWLLTDPKTGQWAKLLDIDLHGKRHIIEDLYCPPDSWLSPFGWLQSGELVVFRVSSSAPTNIVYNVKTGVIHSTFEVDSSESCYRLYSHSHVNSLVPLNTLSGILKLILSYQTWVWNNKM